MSTSPHMLRFLTFSYLFLFFNLSAQRKNTKELLDEIQSSKNDTVIAGNYYQLAKNYVRINADSCRLFAEKSIQISQKISHKKYIAETYSVLGSSEKNQANFDKAIEYHLKAIAIKEELKDTIGLSISNNDIGIVYKNMKRFKEALPYYKASNHYANLAKYGKGESMTYSNIGSIFSGLGQLDSALHYYTKGLEVGIRINDSACMVTALSNIGEYYATTGNHKEALTYFERCIPIDLAYDDQYGLSMDYINIANAYSGMKNYALAKTYLDKAEMAAKPAGMIKELIQIYGMKSNVESASGNYKSALELLRKSDLLSDSLLNEETNQQVSELNTKYQTVKKEKEIAVQKNKIALQKYWIGGIAGLLLAVSLLGYNRYRRLKLEDEAKLKQSIYEEQEKAAKAVLDAEEKERQRIATELHDGVGQLMSAAKLNLSALEAQLDLKDASQKNAITKIIDLISESAKEVRSVSHDLMPNVLLKKGLAKAVQEFINKIDSNVIKVNLHTEGIQNKLNSNVESVLYRVIQECVNNVIKHSEANHLDISLIHDDEGISVSIEDNGKGFNPASIDEEKSVGIANMKSRIDFLKGSLDIDSQIGKGTLIAIFVPIEL